MTLQELQNRKRMVRVVDSTLNPTKETKKMIGGEFEVKGEDYADKTILVYNKDKSDYWFFNRSDVVELTPISFEGRGIAIGDEVKWNGGWYTVIYFFWNDMWRLNVLESEGDFNKDYFSVNERIISAHRIPNSENFIGTTAEITIKGQTYEVEVKRIKR